VAGRHPGPRAPLQLLDRRGAPLRARRRLCATTVEHIERITALIVEICGTPDTKVGPVDDQVVNLPQRQPVVLRTARAQKVIGVAIDDDTVADIFTRLGLPFTREPGRFTVTAPSYRFDIEIEEDLIEEVARVYGFENIPALPPARRAPC
jgi:phenylalanyl-tRNA synthetase beta chain